MLRRLTGRLSYSNVMSTIAVFAVLAGGTAYAANTIGSSDIIDGEVKSVDIGDGEVKSADVKDESLTTFDISTMLGADVVDGTLTGADVQNESLTSADIQNNSLGNGDFLTGSVDGRVATDNSLTGADIQNGQIGQVDLADGAVNSAKTADNSLTGNDINESTLAMPPSTTVGFVSSNGPPVQLGATLQKILARNLPAGNYAIVATANLRSHSPCFATCDNYYDASCELRDTANNFLGGAKDRRLFHDISSVVWRSLSMNGGAQIPAGGGQVSLWCNSQNGSDAFEYGQMMIIRADGFF
jgi:uncharacterized protein YjbI with pentapeptide repeats